MMIDPNLSLTTTDPFLSIDEQVKHHGLEYAEGNELCWPLDDHNHPSNWSFWTKFFNTAVIISLEFFTYISHSYHIKLFANLS
jgi:hypothetical protein